MTFWYGLILGLLIGIPAGAIGGLVGLFWWEHWGMKQASNRELEASGRKGLPPV